MRTPQIYAKKKKKTDFQNFKDKKQYFDNLI